MGKVQRFTEEFRVEGVRQVDLPPINRATRKLVKSDIEGVVGHEEAVYG